MVKERKRKGGSLRESRGDKIFHASVLIFMILFALIILYPLWFVVIASVSNPDSILNGEVWLWPDVVDFSGYKKIFNDPQIWTGYRNTIIYTTLGTALNILLTIPAGYALSRPNLPFESFSCGFLLLQCFRRRINSLLLSNFRIRIN